MPRSATDTFASDVLGNPVWLSNPAAEHRNPLTTEPRPRTFRVSNLLGDPARHGQSRCGPHESRYGRMLPFERVRIPLLIRFGLANQPRRDQKCWCPKPSTATVLRSTAARRHKRLPQSSLKMEMA